MQSEEFPEENPQESRTSETRQAWRSLLLRTTFAVVCVVVLVIIALAGHNRTIMNESILQQARTHMDGLLLIHRWALLHDKALTQNTSAHPTYPLFSLSRKGTQATEEIEKTGKTPIENYPNSILQELAILSRDTQTLLSFHLITDPPIHSSTLADAWEKKALALLKEKQLTEFYEHTGQGDALTFRYMVPLSSPVPFAGDIPDMPGHTLSPGTLYSGLSLRFATSAAHKRMEQSTLLQGTLTVAIGFGLLICIFFFTSKTAGIIDAYQQQLEKLSITDSLTGLVNHREFYSRLGTEVYRSIRYEKNLACVMADLDKFKQINDRYGHQTGDFVLTTVAEIFTRTCRRSDTVARYGGEEFALLLPETTLKGAVTLAEKVRKEIEATSFTGSKGNAFTVTVSLGVTSYTHEELQELEDIVSICSVADTLLYQAKATGRNKVVSCLPHEVSSRA